MFVFPLAAAGISFVFALSLFRQYIDRRKPYQLAWGAALLLFGIGAAAEAVAALGSWNPFLIKTYYIAGATLNVGVLALGSLYVSGDYDMSSPAPTFFLGRRFNMILAVVLTFTLWFLLFGVSKGMLSNNPKVALFIMALYAIPLLAAIFAKDQVPLAYLLVLVAGGIGATFAVLSTGVKPDDAILRTAEGWGAINRTLGMRSGALSFSVVGTFIVIVGAFQTALSNLRKFPEREGSIATYLILGFFPLAGAIYALTAKAFTRTQKILFVPLILVFSSILFLIGVVYTIVLANKHKGIWSSRSTGTLLIALGVLVVASGGFLGGLFEKGGQAAIAIPMAVGVTVMFAGFLQASKPAKPGKAG